LFGDSGDDELYGGPGNDGLSGDENTDKHYGGGNDFIDAARAEDPATDARDLVNCGSGFDTAEVRPNDIVRGNCERVLPPTP
jgi:Ca2+-binding RTX toxin-like protein